MSEKSGADKTVLGNSAVMAAGTVVSRLSGYVRSILLAAALGNALHADVFTIANTIPNMLYILLAGGVFNAVLVPQLVRAMKHDPDGGEAYTNRIITLAAVFLFAVTVLLIIFAPLVMGVYLDSSWESASHAAQRESVIDFARYCLPQVFFYGMFVLVGQILNARGTFGPMMWAPIANNVISVVVLAVYLFAFGPAEGAEKCGGYATNQELLLGIGSTLGIAVQFLILLPYLKAAGFSYRPRFDFRNSGLGHTFRLATWTVLFVIVNQIAYTVVVRLASSGTTQSFSDGCTTTTTATGYTVYSSAFLMIMVPHAIVTVSLATAILPRLSAHAAERDLGRLSTTLGSTLRTTLSLVIPFVLLLPLLAKDLSNVVWGYGASSETYGNFAPSLALFAPGLLFFTVHYLMLRGFYALEQTRTVFWIQCVIAAFNIGLGVVLVAATDAAFTSPSLVLAYGGAYAVGATLSYLLLRRRLGTLHTHTLLRFLVRTVLASLLAAAVAAASWWGLHEWLGDGPPGKFRSLLVMAVIATVHGLIYLAVARVLRLREVNELVSHVTRRLPVIGRR